MIVTAGADNTSAVARAKNPDWAWGLTEHLLAAAVDTLRVLAWQKTQDGHKGRNAPKPIPRPGVVDDTTERVTGDAMPLEQAHTWLGWDQPTNDDGAVGRGD